MSLTNFEYIGLFVCFTPSHGFGGKCPYPPGHSRKQVLYPTNCKEHSASQKSIELAPKYMNLTGEFTARRKFAGTVAFGVLKRVSPPFAMLFISPTSLAWRGSVSARQSWPRSVTWRLPYTADWDESVYFVEHAFISRVAHKACNLFKPPAIVKVPNLENFLSTLVRSRALLQSGRPLLDTIFRSSPFCNFLQLTASRYLTYCNRSGASIRQSGLHL
jgi:hypothetical protein